MTTTVAPNPPPPQLPQPPLSNFVTDPTDFLTITNNSSSNSFDPGLTQGSGSDITDDGFVFSPWMGFPNAAKSTAG